MILKENLRRIARVQREELQALDYGVERELLRNIDLNQPFALVLSGIRRCGKSTLLRQAMKKTAEEKTAAKKGKTGKPGKNEADETGKTKAVNAYYFNFEDSRAVGFKVSDFQKLDDVFHEEFGDSEQYFFDEIQNAEKWELFVRSGLDRKKRFLITGSNASLLSRELGTRLTGRHLNRELYPFSYGEFLAFTRKKPGRESFDEYLTAGGFPEFLAQRKTEVLQQLFNDVIARDVVVRYKLRSAKIVKEMALFLISNAGKEFSYNGLAKTFGLGSANSAVAFVSHLEDCYLLFTVPKFDYSLKKQLVNPKKVYAVDNGLVAANSASFSVDKGRALENQVFLDLKRAGKEVYYFKGSNGSKECDFVVKEKNKITAAIQVCLELNEDNVERETSGLLEAMNEFDLREGLILSGGEEDELEVDGKTARVTPAWKWSLETSRRTQAQ